MNRDRVMQWVAGYERAWREGDRDAIAELFTEDARYYTSPMPTPKSDMQEFKPYGCATKARPSRFALSRSRSRVATP